MSEPFTIIDGYNLMHAAGMARLRYGPGDLERCRTRFLRFLSRRLTAEERDRTTVVFDAGEAPSDMSRRTTLDGMTILFAPAGSDADTAIEELIAAHSAPRRVRVVSSDHRLQKAARRRRGTFVASESFFEQLERRGPVAEPQDRPARPGDAKYTGRVPEEETAEWLEIFGDVDTSELRDEGRQD
jgi:uncharacterized protein